MEGRDTSYSSFECVNVRARHGARWVLDSIFLQMPRSQGARCYRASSTWKFLSTEGCLQTQKYVAEGYLQALHYGAVDLGWHRGLSVDPLEDVQDLTLHSPNVPNSVRVKPPHANVRDFESKMNAASNGPLQFWHTLGAP